MNMKKAMMTLVFVMLLVGLAAQYVPVEIVNQAEDRNGKALVSKFREIIRNSSAYQISYDSESPHFVVQINTMDRFKGDSGREGVSTIYHYMILIDHGDQLRVLCTNQLGYVGANWLDQVAYEIYSDLDDFVEFVRNYPD